MKISPLFVLPFVFVSLLLATWSGLIRIGWNLPVSQTAGHHGALMTGSFLASLIMLERAVTFRQKWVMLLPLVNAASLIAFIGGSTTVAFILLLAGSIGFAIMCLYFIYTYHEQYYYLFFAGAFCLVMANWLLLTKDFYPQAAPWWMGFLLFTIVAERLELSRFLPVSAGRQRMLVGCLLLVLVGLIIPFHLYGNFIFAAGLVLTAAWLLKYDMAFKSLKKPGQHRYSGLLLITGYFWLLVTAFFLVVSNENAFWYDATLHSFFIGFVFSMIFSHAPIILPAVLRLPVKPYRAVLYVWFLLLQLSLVVRMLADVLLDAGLRRWAGMVNGWVIILFFITMLVIVRLELAGRRVKS